MVACACTVVASCATAVGITVDISTGAVVSSPVQSHWDHTHCCLSIESPLNRLMRGMLSVIHLKGEFLACRVLYMDKSQVINERRDSS